MRRVTHPNALTKLLWAETQIRLLCDNITPAIAPRVAPRVRALLKSVQGAIRNAHAQAARANRATLAGRAQ